MRRLSVGLLVAVWVTIGLLPLPVLAKDCVILLHGLSRSASSMAKLELALKKHNYVVVNRGYPSRQKTVAQLASEEIPRAIDHCGEPTSVSFVTHSMGGILVRHYLAENDLPSLKHVVMLAPPNQGSEVVDKLGKLTLFKWLNGPAGKQLGTDPKSAPITLGSANYSVGVIAGSRTINPILSMLIPGRDDGKVSIESTKLDGMNDHITMKVSHAFIMKNKRVIDQVIHFLNSGFFLR